MTRMSCISSEIKSSYHLLTRPAHNHVVLISHFRNETGFLVTQPKDVFQKTKQTFWPTLLWSIFSLIKLKR